MRASWPIVPLGEVLAAREETPDPVAIASGEIPIVAKIGFNDGLVQLRVNGDTRTNMILVRPGDLLVSGINAAKGAIAIYRQENARSVAATIHYGAYVPHKTRVDVRYLWWLLRSDTFRRILLDHLPGGIKTELKAARLLRVPIPLPPLREQQRLVAKLDHLAQRIEEELGLKRRAEQVSASLMESCMSRAMSALTAHTVFGDVITTKPRSGPCFPTHREWEGTPVLMPSSVTGFGVDTAKIERGLGNERIDPRDRLEPGDIVIARGNKRRQVGNAGVVPENARGWVCANLLMRLKLDEQRADPHFCIYWLRSPMMRAHVEAHMKGTSPNIQKINQRIIMNYPFPATSVSEQRRIVAYLDGLQAKLDALRRLQQETAADLDALMPSILDKAFRGEL
jgi:type I restriction enzyme S subunit